MDNIVKLRHLLSHWAEHNSEHARTYSEWARRAEDAGQKELAGVLKEIADETSKLDGLFRKAAGLI